MKIILSFLSSIVLAGCSMFGNAGVEIASYKVVRADSVKNIEIRTYDTMILVSTPMASNGENNAFRTLFSYIMGDNMGAQKIEMTAPVFMDDKKEGVKIPQKIPMTAPVFMDAESAEPMMSFVMPANYTLANTPKPKNANVTVSELKDYTVAVIRFNGLLSDGNVGKHKDILENWIKANDYKITGAYKKAGYNAPFTIPAFRRNEVLIPIDKPE